MAQKDVGNKVPIYKLKKTEEVMRYYDEWGEELVPYTFRHRIAKVSHALVFN